MSHEWHKGILNESSWHGLEEIGVMPNAESMIMNGQRVGAWPTAVELSKMFVPGPGGALRVPGRAVVASYRNGNTNALGAVGDRYTPTNPKEWNSLVEAACQAGAKPTGAFALRGGTRVLATFEVGQNNGIRTNLVLADSFDGSLKLHGGMTSIRVVCANTLSAAMRQDAKEWAQIRHTSGLRDRVRVLADAIEHVVKEGGEVKAAYEAAHGTRLTKESVSSLIEVLFPSCDAKGKSLEGAALTRAQNAQRDLTLAMARSENNVGPTLATLWNGATWLVDRNADGTAREARGGADRLDTLLFGQRGKRLGEIQSLVTTFLKAGSVSQASISN